MNKIFGKITDSSRGGMPLGGLRVSVWDQDWPDGDDLLGESYTSPDGRYEISYLHRSWDLSTGIFGLGRPDIYIVVENQNYAGKWVRLGESEVHHNHNLDQDLRIDLEIQGGSTVSKSTGFLPEVHGFHFRNSFRVNADFLGVNLGEWKMGFCGGMCSSALFRFRNGIPSPRDKEVPAENTSLHRELKKRQIKAMAPRMLPKMYEWQGSPDTSRLMVKKGIGQRTKQEWAELKNNLDQGKPTIIVLIRATGLLGNPTENHQVLAIGYDFDPMSLDLVVSVYDPNIPNKTQTISLNLGLPDGKLELVDSASPKTRGFFVNPVGEETADMDILG